MPSLGSFPLHSKMRLPQGAENGQTEETRQVGNAMKNGIMDKDNFGITPLHRACAAGHVDTVSLLLDRGAMINDRNMNGSTPLHYAASNDRVDVVKLLLERGADYSILNGNGFAPLDNEFAMGNCQAMELVISLTRKNKEMRKHMESEWATEKAMLEKKIAAVNEERAKLLLKNKQQEQDIKDLYKRHAELAGHYKNATAELASAKINKLSKPQETWVAKKYSVVKQIEAVNEKKSTSIAPVKKE